MCKDKLLEAGRSGGDTYDLMLADAQADGAGRKLESVVQEAVKIGRRIEPCTQSSNAYRGRRELYRELYPGLISLLRRCRVSQAETQNDS